MLHLELTGELRRLTKGEVDVGVVLETTNRSEASGFDMEYQIRLTLMNKFFFVACSLCLGEVKIHPKDDVARDYHGAVSTEVPVSRLPALLLQACSDDPQVL